MAAPDLTNIIAYPNPCKGHNKITFKNLTDQCKITIYNIAGELIFEQEFTNTHGKVEWNLKNKSGKDVASGVYIYLITNNQNQKPGIGKIGIVR
ncbi:MAG: T9SS type A sorting domain-containing protein [Gammaproteobacteria bacterium]|nr:T9SS type A sorting domain-containing protein [Gammaproteobacteria bacterium]MBU1927313.1 T9SS type A sorting domain-containing protein [Gammaproteobacteria bacterium]